MSPCDGHSGQPIGLQTNDVQKGRVLVEEKGGIAMRWMGRLVQSEMARQLRTRGDCPAASSRYPGAGLRFLHLELAPWLSVL
jgi:hypothetical protein